MHKCEWKGFGKSRSEALEKAFNKTDYLLSLMQMIPFVVTLKFRLQ